MIRRFLSIGLALCLAVSFAACSKEPVAEGDSPFVFYEVADWEGVDMLQASGWWGAQLLFSDTLLAIDPDTGEAVPSIASDYFFSEDNLTLTLVIPDDHKFANGEQLLPEDVKASLEHGLAVSPYADGISCISDIEIDGNNVVIHLSRFSSDFMFNLCQCFVGVIDKDQLDTMSDEELLWGAIPYGPYSVEHYESGAYCDLVVNPYYKTYKPFLTNKGAPYIEKVHVILAGETFTIIQGLKDGTVDYASIDQDSYAELEGAGGLAFLDASYPTTTYMEFSLSNEFFQDIRVRQAIAYAINREEIVDQLNGAAEVNYTVIAPSMQNYSQDYADEYKASSCNDVEKAKSLLAEAGFADSNGDGYVEKDGKTLAFTYTSRDDERSKNQAQMIQLQLKEIGIQVDIESVDWSFTVPLLESREFDVFNLELGWGEPLLILNLLKYVVPEADKDAFQALIDKTASTVDYDERTKAVAEVERMIQENFYAIPLLTPITYAAYSTRYNDIVYAGLAGLFLNDATLAAS